MSRVYGFSQEGFERVKEATRRTLGTPRTGAQRRRQPPVLSGGGTTTIIQGGGGPWTIAEYDPVTGDILRTFDRGMRRVRTGSTHEAALLFASDGSLYAVGTTEINRSDGGVVKYNPDTGERLWEYSDASKLTETFAPIEPASTAFAPPLAEDDDGNIWVGPGASSICPIKIDPSTGLALANNTVSNVSMRSLFKLSNGKMVMRAGKGASTSISVFDSSVSETASTTTGYLDAVCFGNRIYGITSTAIHILDDSLSLVDSRSAPGSANYAAIETDGSTVWTVTTVESPLKYRAYDATNLATEQWNANRSSGTPLRLHYGQGKLYLSYNLSSAFRRINPADGTEMWSASGMTAAPFWGPAVGIGSDFVVVQGGIGFGLSGVKHIYCLNDSDGAQRWWDWCPTVNNGPGGSVIVTGDDRVFVGHTRKGP